MRFHSELEPHRVRHGTWETSPGSTFGAFEVPYRSFRLYIIADDGSQTGWEHVSVSLVGGNRCPNWDEMCFVKSLFWSEEETVLQFHPRASEYVNVHNYVLHLWRRVGTEHELPPTICV